MTYLGVALGLVSAVVFGVASVVQARSVRAFTQADEGLGRFLASAVRETRVWVVVGLYLVGFVLHAGAILLLPLYLAQAMIAMQLPVTALLGARIESALGRELWAAVGVVSAGLVLLTLGAGKAGTSTLGARAATLVWAGVVVLGLLSLLAPRLGGPALGALGGLGYAGSALSVRGIGTPVDATVVGFALAVPAYSVVAFWLYSLAMRRARVAAASAALIVVQTLVPAAVGVLALHDAVRAGWWPAVVAGLVLATAGSVALSRDEQPAQSSEVAAGG